MLLGREGLGKNEVLLGREGLGKNEVLLGRGIGEE